MREQLFFVADGTFPTPTLSLLPGLRRAIDELGTAFDVVLYDQPWVKGSPAATRDPAQNTRERSAGCHAVTMGATIEPFLAATQGEAIKSLVAAGCTFTSANRLALGMPSSAVADAFDDGTIGIDTTYPWVRLFTIGADDQFQRQIADCFDAQIDWDLYRQRVSIFHPDAYKLGGIRLDIPALYLRSAYDFPGTEEAFLHIFPTAEVGRLRLWPTRLHEEEAGFELASKVIPFIESHSQ
jgi:hypothetical protein